MFVTTSSHSGGGEKEFFSPSDIRRATNIFLLVLLGLFTIDTFPGQWLGDPFVSNLQASIDKINDVTGLWQGTWGLFAPNPAYTDMFVTARLTYRLPATNSNDTNSSSGNDNSNENATVLFHVKWASPHWNTTTTWEKKRLFRMQEFVEDIIKDDNKLLFPIFAKHLADSHPLRIVDDYFSSDVDNDLHAGETFFYSDETYYPIQVSLIRHWVEYPGPDNSTVWPEEGYHWLLGYKLPSTRKPEGEFLYHTWDRPDDWEPPATKVPTYDFLPPTTEVPTSKLAELALLMDTLEEGNTTSVEEGDVTSVEDVDAMSVEECDAGDGDEDNN